MPTLPLHTAPTEPDARHEVKCYYSSSYDDNSSKMSKLRPRFSSRGVAGAFKKALCWGQLLLVLSFCGLRHNYFTVTSPWQPPSTSTLINSGSSQDSSPDFDVRLGGGGARVEGLVLEETSSIASVRQQKSESSLRTTPPAAARSVSEEEALRSTKQQHQQLQSVQPIFSNDNTVPIQIHHEDDNEKRLLVEDYPNQYSRTCCHRVFRHYHHNATFTPPQRMDIIINLVQSWHNFMTGLQLPYWLAAGSLLGQYCKEGVLDGDDDADIAMLHTTFLELIQRTNRKKVSSLIPSGTQLIVKHPLSRQADVIGAKFVDVTSGFYIDISLWYRGGLSDGDENENGILLRHNSFNHCYDCQPGNWLVVNEAMIFPIVDCEFEGMLVHCPREPLAVLKKLYKRPFFNCNRERQNGNTDNKGNGIGTTTPNVSAFIEQSQERSFMEYYGCQVGLLFGSYFLTE